MPVLHITKRYSFCIFHQKKVRKVRDPRQTDHGDLDQSSFWFPAESFCQAVFILNLDLHIRYNSRYRNTAAFPKHLYPGIQYGFISAKFIDDQPSDQFPLIFFKQHQRAQKLCEHTAPVYIAHQKDRRFYHLRHPHIHDIVLLQVNLGRTSRPLDYDNIILFLKLMERRQNIRHQPLLISKIFPCTHISQYFAVDNHLRPGIIRRLQQDRVHLRPGGNARRFRLNRLRPPHLKSLLGDVGI